MVDNYPLLTETKDLMIFLHNYIYTHQTAILKLKEELELQFAPEDINYNEEEKRFELRLKKENDLNPDFKSNIYCKANIALYNFFKNPEIYNNINYNLNMTYKTSDPFLYKRIETSLNSIIYKDYRTITLLYTLIVFSDNHINDIYILI